MSDLSTYAGQAEHYAGVRARLGSLWSRKATASVPDRLRPPVPAEPTPAPPPYGAPINLLDFPSARTIVKLVALRSGVSVDDIVGPRRSRGAVAVRNIAIGLVYSHCSQLSLPAIGRLFHRDHTSILHSLRATKKSRDLPAAKWVLPVITHSTQAGGL